MQVDSCIAYIVVSPIVLVNAPTGSTYIGKSPVKSQSVYVKIYRAITYVPLCFC